MMPPLPAALCAYTAPQQRFEQLRERTLEHRASRVHDLAYANAHDGAAPDVVDAIRDALSSPRALDLQYTPYGGSVITRRVVARSLGDVAGTPFEWRHVVMTPGAMAALNVAFRAARREARRDEALVITPCWIDHPLYLANLGFHPRLVPVQPDTLRLDLAAIGRALNPDTRVVVLSQPCNPTGLVYGEDELAALGALLSRAPSRPLLVSDECHRDFRFGDPAARMPSPADYYPCTCVVYSFGKSWSMQGQRVGYAAVSPAMPRAAEFAERLVTWCRVMGYCTPTALMQLTVNRLVGRRPDLTAVAARRERAIGRLERAGYELVPSEATFFLYPRVPRGVDDFAYAELLARDGVLVLPSSVFHHQGHVRLSLTARDEDVDAALDVMAAIRVQGSAA